MFEVEKSLEKNYKIEIEYEYKYPLTGDELQKLRYEQNKILNLSAPVSKGTDIARSVILSGEKKIVEISLNLQEEILRKNEKEYFYMLITNLAKCIKM